MATESSERSKSKKHYLTGRKRSAASIAKFKRTMAARRKGRQPVIEDRIGTVQVHAMAKRVYLAYKAELGETGELTDLIVAAHVLCKAILGE